MKRAFSGKLHKTLDEVSDFIVNEVNQLTNQIVKTTCNFEYIFLHNFGLIYTKYWYNWFMIVVLDLVNWIMEVAEVI